MSLPNGGNREAFWIKVIDIMWEGIDMDQQARYEQEELEDNG